VNEGVNIPPRGQISLLGASDEVNGPLEIHVVPLFRIERENKGKVGSWIKISREQRSLIRYL
jgi:hypothetical protein